MRPHEHDPPKKVIMACYGGGHVQSLIPVAKALSARPEIDLLVVGFTTARASFQRAGIPAESYCYFLDDIEHKWLKLARRHAPASRHADITEDENLAYHAIGLQDLAAEEGQEAALAKFERFGRKCFLPTRTFDRFLNNSRPDLVITSSSPRSELAMIRSARQLGIETLVISDLFLQAEAKYVCATDYAANVSVLSDYVRDFLFSKGCQSHIWVTGNPAFDPLVDAASEDLRLKRRHELGLLDTQSLVMWVCPSAAVSILGRPFADPSAILNMLKDLTEQTPGTQIMVRQHPNERVLKTDKIGPAFEPPANWKIEDCLAACDSVLVETSTVGLQAALLGKPVVTIKADGYPPYATLGLATDVLDVNAALPVLQNPTKPDLARLGAPSLGSATARVLRVIETLLVQRQSAGTVQ
ncbi:hypothetical protein E2K80_11665 [Rhodophyticola sp. CCM32]|uniref:capsular polysaccharide export protein, LipB/KpsS family n=1 Tax=Rhodophyticola sp. CCM32 TaxID=2916397 RepID=UPI00107F91E0|nr:hypothetical protein [Rhodophyticola sp. CCM32]QBY01303.1 hypothetical protein E2K80_11665 [Rhodophyticola sp. CCM32]